MPWSAQSVFLEGREIPYHHEQHANIAPPAGELASLSRAGFLGGSTTMSGTQARGRAMTTGLSQRRPLHNEQQPSQSSLRECHDHPSPCHWRNGRLHTIMSSTQAGRSSRTASTSVSRPPGAGRSCSFLHNFVALSGYHAAPEPEGGMPWPAQTPGRRADSIPP